MTGSAWDPAQYERFRDERSQPFFDLTALVQPRPGMRIVDLGCGTGELTRVLHRHLAARETVGIDNADTMLAQSASFAGDGLRFAHGDIGAFAAERDIGALTHGDIDTFTADGVYDLIFSNAAIHWVPDHPALLQHLTAALAAEGQIAIQMPANHDHPSHTVAEGVAREEPFASALGGYVRHAPVLPPEEYAVLLDHLGYRAQHVRLQVYVHHLTSRDEVVEWVKGTLLTDYKRRLPPDLYEQFLQRYRERLLPQLSPATPYVYPFKRILLWGQR